MCAPTFLLAGGARCGTTAVAEALRAHPDIFVTTPKEPHYFALHRIGAHFTGPGDEASLNRVSVTDREQYLALYSASDECAVRGEGSVSTLYYAREAVPEILSINPAMRIVVLLREPVARAYSAHQYMRGRGLEPVEDFLEAVAREAERTASGWQHIWHYTAMSRYADSMQVLMGNLPREQLGVWFYDDLETDFAGTVRSILDFVGARQLAQEPSQIPRVNVSGQPRSQRLTAILARAAASDPVRSAVKRTTSFRFRELVRRRLLSSHAIPLHVREELAPLFGEDLARLRALLPMPGPSWFSDGGRP